MLVVTKPEYSFVGFSLLINYYKETLNVNYVNRSYCWSSFCNNSSKLFHNICMYVLKQFTLFHREEFVNFVFVNYQMGKFKDNSN